MYKFLFLGNPRMEDFKNDSRTTSQLSRKEPHNQFIKSAEGAGAGVVVSGPDVYHPWISHLKQKGLSNTMLY